jgi:hypothetical protein
LSQGGYPVAADKFGPDPTRHVTLALSTTAPPWSFGLAPIPAHILFASSEVAAPPPAAPVFSLLDMARRLNDLRLS